jgi:hypothetical protein
MAVEKELHEAFLESEHEANQGLDKENKVMAARVQKAEEATKGIPFISLTRFVI